jgi:hypothetical protein
MRCWLDGSNGDQAGTGLMEGTEDMSWIREESAATGEIADVTMLRLREERGRVANIQGPQLPAGAGASPRSAKLLFGPAVLSAALFSVSWIAVVVSCASRRGYCVVTHRGCDTADALRTALRLTRDSDQGGANERAK